MQHGTWEQAAERDAAVALFAAWHELHLLALSLPFSAWPVLLGRVEYELSNELVLRALPAGARSLVEQYVDEVRRCRCGARIYSDLERLRDLCVDCAADLLMEADDVE